MVARARLLCISFGQINCFESDCFLVPGNPIQNIIGCSLQSLSVLWWKLLMIANLVTLLSDLVVDLCLRGSCWDGIINSWGNRMVQRKGESCSFRGLLGDYGHHRQQARTPTGKDHYLVISYCSQTGKSSFQSDMNPRFLLPQIILLTSPAFLMLQSKLLLFLWLLSIHRPGEVALMSLSHGTAESIWGNSVLERFSIEDLF